MFLQHLKKKNIDKFYFLLADKLESFLKLILTFWMCLAISSQSTHNFFVWIAFMQQKVAILNQGEVSISQSNSCKKMSSPQKL